MRGGGGMTRVCLRDALDVVATGAAESGGGGGHGRANDQPPGRRLNDERVPNRLLLFGRMRRRC